MGVLITYYREIKIGIKVIFFEYWIIPGLVWLLADSYSGIYWMYWVYWIFLPKVHIAKTDLMGYRNSACCLTRSHIYFGHCNIMHDSVTRKIRVLCDGSQYRFFMSSFEFIKQLSQKSTSKWEQNDLLTKEKKDFYFAVLANYTVTCNYLQCWHLMLCKLFFLRRFSVFSPVFFSVFLHKEGE